MVDNKTRIAKAKTNLVFDHPFFGALALGMPAVLTDDPAIPTAATDGKTVWFNNEFVDKLTDEQLTFLVAHECMHPMFEHNFRRGNRDHKLWNQAADYVINQLLVDENIGRFIDGGCLNKDLYDAGKGTSEGIYALLPEPEEGDGGGEFGNGGGAYDDIKDGGASQGEMEQAAAEWKVKVAQAAQAAKMRGKLSANVERLVGDVLSQKVNWKDVLRDFLVKAKNDSRSWARPNRRFAAQGMYLPSVSGEAMGEISVAVDCSGSIGAKELDQFAAELRAIKADMNPACIHVIYFDHAVCHYDKFERDDELILKPHGGGGTAFSPVFDYMDEHDITPIATVFLTDLYCNDFGNEPDHPVLWVTYGDTNAPFGQVVPFKLD